MKAVGLIVAAGLSQRMGQFKPLLPIGGKPMIERTLSTCVQANIRENVVVVGHCAHLVVQALRHMDVRFLYNAAYQTADMLSSVQLGLDHIATQTDAEAAFLLPADMPAISPRLMPRLLSCMEQTGADVVFPSREMRPDAPAAAAPALLQPGDPAMPARAACAACSGKWRGGLRMCPPMTPERAGCGYAGRLPARARLSAEG